jgi:hypothetical protein
MPIALLYTAWLAGVLPLAGSPASAQDPAPGELISNDIGLDDSVPPPWTPMRAAEGVVSCWGRDYDFGDAPFPRQVTSGGCALLDAPITLGGEVNGRALVWETSHTRVAERGQGTVVLESEASSSLLRLRVRSTCEFDGLVRLDLALEPTRSRARVDELVLTVPLRREFARLKYGYGNISYGGQGAHFPTEKDIIGDVHTPWRFEFLPGLWLGDEEHGLGWYAESQEGWSQEKPDGALSLDAEGNAVVLRVHLVDTPLRLTGPHHLTFGLQATPAKPFPRPHDWLTYRPVTCPGNRLFIFGWGGDNTRWQGFPVVGDEKGLLDGLARKHGEGLLCPIYLNPGVMIEEMPEAAANHAAWECTPQIWGGMDTGQKYILACPRSRQWADLYIARLREFVSRYPVDAVYMDFSFSQRCSNVAHGCGYERAGTRHGGWPIFAQHELHKRIYKVMRALRPDTPLATLGHPGGALGLPHTSFWDACVEGEYINVDIRGPVYDEDYTAFYSPGRFTVEYSGRTFGMVPLFMGFSMKQTETVLAMALVNGSVVWPAWIRTEQLFALYQALDRFGVSDIQRFVPYWNLQGAVTGCSPGVLASAYCKPGKALVALANLTPSPVGETLLLDPLRLSLGRGALTVSDAMTGEAVVCGPAGRVPELRIGAKSWRLLLVSTPSAGD